MNSHFNGVATPLQGLQLLQRTSLEDARGHFQRLFDADELTRLGWPGPIAQVNHSYTLRKGSVRGLHLQQAPYAEAKLITCLRGEVWDVAVDLRKDSGSFLKWHAVHLSERNRNSYLIPAGFAHGFQTLSDEVELLYCHSQAYMPSAEMGLNVQDTQLGISWPLAITEISVKDQNWPMLARDFRGIHV